MASLTHSIWGCVLTESSSFPEKLQTVDRPFRVTAASIQHGSPALELGHTISVLLSLKLFQPPIEIAYLDLVSRHVTLGITFKAGDSFAFHKRTRPENIAGRFIVQLTGYYLNPSDFDDGVSVLEEGDPPLLKGMCHKCVHSSLRSIGRKLDALLDSRKKETYGKNLEEGLKEKEELGEENEGLKREKCRLEEDVKMLLEEELRKTFFD